MTTAKTPCAQPARARLHQRCNGATHSFRTDDRASAIARRITTLRALVNGHADAPAVLARLLRDERRAARAGWSYDPVRHAALCRLVKEAAPERFRGTRG